jgi:TP901 family phage tail tape measure protein
MAVDVGTALAYLDLDTSKFTSGLSTAQSSLSAFVDSSLSVSDRITALGTAFTTMGSTLTKTVTLPIVAVGTAAVATASEFDTSMSKVKAISGATSDEMKILNDKAIEMGASTKFSAKESADAFTYMAMAGWDAEQMVDGISGIMSLAAADGLDLATTSDIVTDALTAFGLQASDSSHFADVLATASSSANTNVSMLGESFQYVAPVAGSLGMSVEDVSVALGLMANNGIKGSQAGTALRTALTNMVKPTDAMQGVMEELNIEVANSDGSMKSLSEIMDILRDRFGDLTEEEQANKAATLFGKEAMSAMLAIINTSEDDYNKLADAIANADGKADEMSNTMLDNLSGSITLLKSALESLMIKLGEALVPTIKQVTEFITKLIEKLNSLSDEQIQQIVKIAAIVAAVGPVLIVVGKIITAVGTVVSVITKVAIAVSALNPTTLAAIAVIGMLITTIVLVVKYWDTIKEKITEIGETIKTQFNKFKEFCGKILDNLSEVISGLKEKLVNFVEETIPNWINSVIEWFEQLPGKIEEKFEELKQAIIDKFMQILNSIIEKFEELKQSVVDKFESLKQSVVNKFNDILNSIVEWKNNMIARAKETGTNFVNAIQQFFDELPYKLGYAIGYALQTVINWKDDMIAKAKETGTNFVNALVEFFTELPGRIYDFITTTYNNIADWGKNTVDKAEEVGKSFLDIIVEFFTELPGKIYDFITTAYNHVVDWATNMWNKAVETGTNFINALVGYFTTLPGKIYNFITTAYNHVITWATNMWNKAKETGNNFVNAIVEYFTTLPGKIYDFITKAFNYVKDWATDMWNKAKEVGKNFLDTIVDFFSKLPGKAKEKLDEMVEAVLKFKDAFFDAGKAILNSLWDGLKEIWNGIVSWFEGVKDKVASFVQGIKDGMSSASSSTNGSHANGLDYVPYNGYVAELHQGERVLTKSENEQYNSGNSSGGDTYIFYSYEKLDEYETAKQMKRAKKQLELDFV